MDQLELANRFDHERPRLRAVAYRILGSTTEADDAVQEAWLRTSSADLEDIQNLSGWLTTVTARVCLNMLRARRTRHEEPLEGYLPEPILASGPGVDPEQEALLAEQVGIALQVVLEALPAAERLAFVLHDMFAVPFDEIASMLERSPQATRQLASRARRRVQTAAPSPDPDLARQRRSIDAFFEAARSGDLDALVAVLHPDVILRSHRRDGTIELRGAERAARGASAAQRFYGRPTVRPVLVHGTAGALAFDPDRRPVAILAFTVTDDRIVTLDIYNDPELISGLIQSSSLDRLGSA